MYIKIVRNYGSSDDPPPEKLFECKSLDWRRIGKDEKIGLREDVVYAFHPPEVPTEPTSFEVEMWLWDKEGEPTQILLRDATVYVMNDRGGTIDTIYA